MSHKHWELVDQAEPTHGKCAHCGYCSCCGRQDFQPITPSYPYPVYPWSPNTWPYRWTTISSGTSSNGFSINGDSQSITGLSVVSSTNRVDMA